MIKENKYIIKINITRGIILWGEHELKEYIKENKKESLNIVNHIKNKEIKKDEIIVIEYIIKKELNETQNSSLEEYKIILLKTEKKEKNNKKIQSILTIIKDDKRIETKRIKDFILTYNKSYYEEEENKENNIIIEK